MIIAVHLLIYGAFMQKFFIRCSVLRGKSGNRTPQSSTDPTFSSANFAAARNEKKLNKNHKKHAFKDERGYAANVNRYFLRATKTLPSFLHRNRSEPSFIIN